MKELCVTIYSLFGMTLLFFAWVIVFCFNIVLAIIGFSFLAIAYPFVWIYEWFRKWKNT